ncbi:MAG: hypothetical protein KatS3mg008_0927 [Acidimicrobiales bacterium]|nr:MAG: hypothetical protein KatS3mg008_0927 [Acidimicrobiales bacterium]
MSGARAKITAAMLAAAVLAGGFATPAGAQATTCRISDFRRPDGTLDIQAYLACVAAASGQRGQPIQEGGGLPATGSETGQLLALGIALVLLGAGAKIGSSKLAARREVEAGV